jgi:hypothetical protein
MRTVYMSLVAAVIGTAACSAVPTSSPAPAPSGVATTAAAANSGDAASGQQPSIMSVSPNLVSTTGGAWGTISGSQFQPGATIQIGDSTVTAVFRDSTLIQFARSSSHAPGSVDITVTNPGGKSVTLAHGYTFAPASTFDPNGDWIGHADARNNYVIDMRFTIRDNQLVSVSCGTPLMMPVTVPVPAGTFSFAGVDGLAMTGTMASTITSFGQTTAPGCGDGQWWADKTSAR